MPRVVDRGAKKEQLLHAALAVFAERGYHGATMQSVAERAGVSKGAVYEYFPSKEALLLESAETLLRAVADQSIAALERDPATLRSRVTAYVDSILHGVDDWTEMCLGILQVWAELGASEDGPLRVLMAEMYSDSLSRIQSVFDAEVAAGRVAEFPTRAAAATLLAAVDGLIIQAIVLPDEFHAHLTRGEFARWCGTLVPSPCEQGVSS
jgi:AcrR family transcriptional regulator